MHAGGLIRESETSAQRRVEVETGRSDWRTEGLLLEHLALFPSMVRTESLSPAFVGALLHFTLWKLCGIE